MDKPESRPGNRLSGIAVFPEERGKMADPSSGGLHLAIGMFDGVHTGHQVVINSAIQASRKDPGSKSGVLTFDPHPSRILHPGTATDLLMSLEARIDQMLAMELDFVFVRTFTLEYSKIQADAFVSDLKVVFPNLKSLHVGANFRFGAGRSGNVDTLNFSAGRAGLSLEVLDRLMETGEPVSSSRIRRILATGDMEQVANMLGRPYMVSGTVIEGKRIGRKIGFPTLNIKWDREALPKFGVYKAWVLDEERGESRLAVANFGLRPTVAGGEDPLLEVHLLETGSIPETGHAIQVALSTFIRPEKTFSSLDELRQQILKDVDQVRNLPGEGGGFHLPNG